jgi:Tol biopolymer transport system component
MSRSLRALGHRSRPGLPVLFAVLAAALAFPAHDASACCDVIPAPDDFDRAALGSITRPALIPGFPAEVFASPAVCSQQTRSAAADFRNPASPVGCDNDALSCAPLPASDFQVNFFFTPSSPTAPRHAVVLRNSCTGFAPVCALPNGGQLHCIEANPADYEIVDVATAGAASERRLRFRFPDTTGLVAPGVLLAGPVRVSVTRTTDPFPCTLATSSCAAVNLATTRLVTCADTLFARDGTCATTSASVDPVDLNVTALPAPNAFVDLCPASDPSGLCRASGAVAPEVRFTEDAYGNLLFPMDYRDVLVRVLDEPFPRTLRGALAAGGSPLVIKNNDHIESRATNFAPVLPIFEPLTDPARLGELFGAIDAGFVIHRVFAHSCNEDPEIPCSVDAECTAGCGVVNVSGLPLGEASGAGPMVGECPLQGGLPACRLGGTVTIDALTAAKTDDRVVAAPVNECVGQLALPAQPSRNFDGDTRDVVLTLFDRIGFDIARIGEGTSDGVAMTRILDQSPFAFNSQDSDGETTAFLQSELQDCSLAEPEACDRNGNGSVFDNILRVFRLGAVGAGTADDLLAGVLAPEVGPGVVAPGVTGLDVGTHVSGQGFFLAVEPDLVVGDAPVAVSGDLVFFRADPSANLARAISLVSAGATGVSGGDASVEGAVSADGRFAAFASDADNLAGKSVPRQVLLKDLQTNAIRFLSLRHRASCAETILLGDGDSSAPALSGEGRHVAFASVATNLLNPAGVPSNDTNGAADVFVADNLTCAVVRVSVDSFGVEANGASANPSVSGDGRFVVFESAAQNLDPGDANPGSDVFLHDRDADADGVFDEPGLDAGQPQIRTVRLSVGGVGESVAPAIAGESGEVAFETDAALAPDDQDSLSDVVFEDGAGGLARASVASDGSESDADSFAPSISASGRWIAFESDATNLDLGATGGQRALFVHDRETGTTRRVGRLPAPRECSLLPDPGLIPDGDSHDVQISANGRFLVYRSRATNLDPRDGSPTEDVLMEDLRTGAITRLSQSSAGVAGDLDSGPADVSEDASAVVFASQARNLGPAIASGAESSVYASRSQGAGGARIGVADLRSSPPRVYVLDLPAEYVAVGEGAAAFVAPGENVKLVRLSCGGSVGGPVCDESCSQGCDLVVEDLLRPGLSAPGAVAISDRFVCAVVEEAGSTRPACHEIGTSPSASLDDVASVPADTIQVVGTNAVFTSPEGSGRALYELDLAAPAPQSVRLQAVEDVVLGDVACFTTRESDLARDENGDGDLDDAIMFGSDPADATSLPTSCAASATPCRLSACDPRKPHSVVPTRTCKFLSDDELRVPDCVVAGRDLNLDGNCSYLVRRCTVGIDPTIAVVGGGNVFDPNARENPVEVQEGDSDVASACVLPGQPGVPLGPCPCAAPQVCSDALLPPRLFTLLTADGDGDGVLDATESCDTTSDPDPVDCDDDDLSDACDGFVCGDGVLQAGEICDAAAPSCPAVPFASEFCTAGCLPSVRLDVTESAVNPGKNGKVPLTILASPLLNFENVPVGSLPAQMVDPTSVRFAAVRNGVCMANRCISSGPSDGTPCTSNATCGTGFCAGTSTSLVLNDQNGDGLRDLRGSFPAPGSGIKKGTTQACITGRFSFAAGNDPAPPFEASDAINVK